VLSLLKYGIFYWRTLYIAVTLTVNPNTWTENSLEQVLLFPCWRKKIIDAQVYGRWSCGSTGLRV